MSIKSHFTLHWGDAAALNDEVSYNLDLCIMAFRSPKCRHNDFIDGVGDHSLTAVSVGLRFLYCPTTFIFIVIYIVNGLKIVLELITSHAD